MRLAKGVVPPSRMNATEQKYADVLEYKRRAGEIAWWAFEPIKLRLADNTFYTPDFLVMLPGGELECHEVKATWLIKGKPMAAWRDDARVKIKVAAESFPFRFIAVNPTKDGGWQREEIG